MLEFDSVFDDTVTSSISNPAPSHLPVPRDAAEHRWLQGFSAELQSEIWQSSRGIRVARGKAVFAQGEASDAPHAGLYLVLSGQLQVANHSVDGQAHILSVLTPGSAFGVVGLMEGGPRPVSVQTLTACELRMLPRTVFLGLMQKPAFMQRIAHMGARKIASLSSVYHHAVSGDAAQRLARRLLLLAQDDDAFGPAVQREFYLSQDMLANMLGISRQWVSKHLQALCESGAIQLRYRRLYIADIGLLQEAAGVRQA